MSEREYLLLRYRNAIAEKESYTASANRELQQYGQWNCDWGSAFLEINREIDDLQKLLSTNTSGETPWPNQKRKLSR